jgi:TRAP-type transport system periplasmic protein
MRKTTVLAALITCLALILILDRRLTPAGEPAISPIKLKLMAINRTVTQYKLWEEWAQAVEKRANGRVKFEFTSLPELGLGGAETIRVTKTGVVDIAEFYLGYVAGELPMVEMLEIPGVFPDQEAMKGAFQAWRPHLARLIDEKVNGVLLATAFQTDQFLFSKRAVRTMDDFKGMKIRVHSVAIAQLVAGFGGDPLTIAFAEVYTGLERGTLDGGFTASGPGYSQKWYEVTRYLVGPLTQMVQLPLVINKNVWRKLPADIQTIFREEAERLIDNRAFDLREQWHREGIEGNVARGMERVPLTPDIQAAVKEVLRSRVVPSWVQRAGGQEAARLFNDIVGPYVGFTVAP